MFNVAVIGAGMAGLFCAQQLAQAGYTVVVVEKSRGLGGRVATRRLHGTCADHGVRYLEPQGQLSQQLVKVLCDRHLLQVWTDTVHELEPERRQLRLTSQPPRYVAPTGMSAIAKFLATDLEIWLNQRVQAITLTTDNSWHLTLESTKTDSAVAKPKELTAAAVVFAIPAPQALMLLAPLAEIGLPAVFLNNLRSVEFDPCLSVIAGYPTLHQDLAWKAVTFLNNPDLAWIGLDSSKRMGAECSPVFVAQSSARFAQRNLEAQDLHPAGHQLLNHAAECLLPLLDTPDWMQVHRWRYAFPRRSWHEAYLSAGTHLPLVCCGDWCGDNRVEGAMLSGLAAAEQINDQLQQRSLPGVNFCDFLVKQTTSPAQ